MINLSQLSIPAIIFFIVASLILILLYFWNDNLSSRARARRKRLSEFTDYLRLNQNKLELSIARDGDAGVFEHFSQKLPGFDRLELLLMRAGSNKSPLQILIYSLLIFLFIYSIYK
jgi:Flp pilus assembly protein TadB